jgi:uncharacterized protein YheU (UPF0270 family)
MDSSDGMRIPHDALEPATLRSVVQELVTRDGTEFTEGERKIEQVLDHLREGRVELWFETESKTFNLVRADLS